MVAAPTSLTEAQIELLDLFALQLPNDSLAELKQLLLQFKFDQLDKLATDEWEAKKFTQETMNERLHGHSRTPYTAQNRFLQQSGPKP